MRICVVSPVYHPALGGIGRQAVGLTEELRSRGVNIFVITRKLKEVPSFNSKIKSINVWAYRPSAYRIEKKTIPNILTSLTFSFNLLITLIKQRKNYDIVHFHGASIPLLMALPLLKFLKKKVVTKVSSAKLGIEAGSFYGRYGIMGRFFIRILRHVDAFVAISEEIKEGLIFEGYSQDRIYRIPNFVDISIFYPGNRKNSQVKTILFSGVLDKRKGVDILLAAWKNGYEINQQAKLIILGEGSSKESLVKIAEDLHITGGISFLGQVADVPNYLRLADIFVLPSIQEGMPNSLLEAMACGLPCIASRIGGVVDVIEDGKSGILFEPGNVSELASAMIKLLNDAELRHKLGAEARKRIVESFSIDRIADKYIKLYEKL